MTPTTPPPIPPPAAPLPAPSPSVTNSPIVEIVPSVAASIVIATTLIGIAKWLYGRYTRTIGKRRELRRKLDRLATNVRVEYIAGILGEPAFRTQCRQWNETVWWLESAAVQVISRISDGAVEQFSITCLDNRLRPRFVLNNGSVEGLPVVLGKTKYCQLTPDPSSIRVEVGARRIFYREDYYFGNPGYYQTYTLSYNDGSPVGDLPGDAASEISAAVLANPDLDPDPRDPRYSEEVRVNLRAIRENHSPNTLTVETSREGSAPAIAFSQIWKFRIAQLILVILGKLQRDQAVLRASHIRSHLSGILYCVEPLPFTLGPDQDNIRVLPDYQHMLRQSFKHY